jgi:hypothetical protein
MPTIIAFDVNETLLDLRALDPLVGEVFGDAALRPLWFAQMLQLSFVGTITGNYVDFTTLLVVFLEVLARPWEHRPFVETYGGRSVRYRGRRGSEQQPLHWLYRGPGHKRTFPRYVAQVGAFVRP